MFFEGGFAARRWENGQECCHVCFWSLGLDPRNCEISRQQAKKGFAYMSMVSEALGRISSSPTVGISQKARQMRQAGRDVIALSAGEPDFDTPDHIKRAAVAAIEAGHTKYTNIEGIDELREAVAAKFARDNHLKVEAKDCFVATGGKQIIFNALIATLNPGDEVVVPVPYWVSYPDIVHLAGARAVFAVADAQTSFKLTPEVLEGAISADTKWVILNSPSNPTGAAYSAKELEALGEVLLRHPQVHILSDDIYERLLYDGRRFATMVEVVPALASRTLTLNGVSKSHAMTGWRLGYCTAPAHIIEVMKKLQSQSTTHASSISQWAAVEALNGDNRFLDEWRKVFQGRRDMVVGALNAIDGIECLTPDGAFYVFPSIAGLLGKTSAGGRHIGTDEDFVMALLEESGVALVHGSAFGLAGYFRLSYAASNEQLEEALNRIGVFARGCARS